MSTSTQLVQKLWNYCNILPDDGLSYGDYVEQLTYLLFLKMADELNRTPFNKPSAVPKGHDWRSPLAEVERRLSVVEELETVVTVNLQRGIRLRQSILQKEFSGNLVAQPPNEQPTKKNSVTRGQKGTAYVQVEN